MNKTCKFCGDSFPLTRDQIELIQEGYISLYHTPDHCPECNSDIYGGSCDYSYEQHSDADSGL